MLCRLGHSLAMLPAQIDRLNKSAHEGGQHAVWLLHFRREDWNTDAEGDFTAGASHLHRKRQPPTGYGAEGFLCGSSARSRAPATPQRLTISGGVSTEWVKPDASLARMEEELTGSSHRSLLQRAAAGHDAAVKVAAEQLVKTVPVDQRPAVAKRVAKVQQRVKASAAAHRAVDTEQEPVDVKALLAENKRLRAEQDKHRRLQLLPPVCAERMEAASCLRDGILAQTGFHSVDQFKAFLGLFQAYYPKGIKPLYRGLESLDPEILQREVEERVKKASRVPAEDLPWFDAANEGEWRAQPKVKKQKKTTGAKPTRQGSGKARKQQRGGDTAAKRKQKRQHNNPNGVDDSVKRGRKSAARSKPTAATGLAGEDDEWLSDIDMNQVQQHLPGRQRYYRSQWAAADYYPLPVESMIEAVNRYVRGEKSTKITQVFDHDQLGCWLLNKRGVHWVMLFLDGRHNRGYYLDSLGQRCPAALLAALKQAASRSGAGEDEFDGWVWFSDGALGRVGQVLSGQPLQADSYQCGVWALVAEGWALQFIQSNQDDFIQWLGRECDAPAGGSDRGRFIADKRLTFRVTTSNVSIAQVVARAIDVEACLQGEGQGSCSLKRSEDNKVYVFV